MQSVSLESETVTALDVNWVRDQFPSLRQSVNGRPAVFLDGPGGTQVPQRVIDAISGYLSADNANTGGAFATSHRSDAILAEARCAMADFLNCSADEIVFGANMTALTFAISRAIGRDLNPGDEILLTRLDHDANFAPWKALEERGVTIKIAEINLADCTLDMNDFASKVTSKTKLIAVGMASNAVGTINPLPEIIRLAKRVGALTYIDAVHYAPHGLIDVQALDCDFLVCSTYKFFGPHMGVLFGKREHLRSLKPYKVRASSNEAPHRWEWGTLNHECIAGIAACVDYVSDLGRHSIPAVSSRREAIVSAFEAIHTHERKLMEILIAGLQKISGLTLYGIADPARFAERCPTIAVRIAGRTPLELATRLGDRGFFTWDGNFYAINLTERLGVEKDGGFLRIGLAHYNTSEEIDRLLAAMKEIA